MENECSSKSETDVNTQKEKLNGLLGSLARKGPMEARKHKLPLQGRDQPVAAKERTQTTYSSKRDTLKRERDKKKGKGTHIRAKDENVHAN